MAEERPGDQRRAMAAPEPFRPGHRQRKGSDRVGEGDREPHVSEIEHRGVDRHQDVVLEQWVGPGAVEWGLDSGERPRTGGGAPGLDCIDADFERVGHGEHQAEEEDPNPAHHRQRGRPEGVGGLPVPA